MSKNNLNNQDDYISDKLAERLFEFWKKIDASDGESGVFSLEFLLEEASQDEKIPD